MFLIHFPTVTKISLIVEVRKISLKDGLKMLKCSKIFAFNDALFLVVQ